MRETVWGLTFALILSSGAPAFGQGAGDQTPQDAGDRTGAWLNRPGNPWIAKPVAPISWDNSSRLAALMRGGNIYLSLQDAIALALENNLDVELQRFNTTLADTDVLRARGGGNVRGVGFNIIEPPNGLGGPSSPLLNSATPGLLGASSIPVNISDLAATTQGAANLAITSGTFSPGPPIPVYDPSLTGGVTWQHVSTPQTNAFITGTNVLVNKNVTGNLGVTQGFSSGTQLGLNFTGANQNTNSVRSILNPFTNSGLGLTITQPLLRGFSMAVNRRFIRIANNDQRISDLVFRQQLMDTVTGVIRLYFDLVSLNEDVRVRQEAVDLAQQLYANNQKQVQQGTLAQIEVVRAQALVAAAQQDLANSQGFAREQELVLKNVLTRRGTADAAIRAAHIVTTDPVPVPVTEPVQPIQDLISSAFQNRPDLLSAGIQIDNSQISLEGSRNALLPDVSLVGAFQNSGLAGGLNPVANVGGATFAAPPPEFLGGFGSTLSQIFRRNYPTYGVGVQLTLPLRNRVAQADVVRDEVQLRQTEVQRQRLENQVRLEVEASLIALERTRAAYDAAVQSLALQQESLSAEQKRYAVGLSTTYLVGQYQAQLSQARSTEIAARAAYAKARVGLERAIGMTLQDNNVSVEEGRTGRISRPPAAIPAVVPNGTTAPK